MEQTQNSQISQYGKVPPQAVELEKEVLAAIIEGRVKVGDILPILDEDEMFYNPVCQTIAQAIRTQANKGGTVDLLIILEELKKSGDIDQVGGAYGLSTLSSGKFGFVMERTAIEYAKVIRAKYINRKLISIGGELMQRAFEDEDSVESIYNLNLELDKIAQQANDKELRHIADVLVDVYENISREMVQKVEFTGVPTGFQSLNKLTGGWQKTDLIILAARPSVGKTAFALNLAYSASADQPTAVFSLEMGEQQLARRLVSISTKIPLDEISRPYTIRDKDTKMMQISSDINLQDRKLFIDDTPGLKVSQLKAKCMKIKKKHGLGLIIIDYLQLMEGDKDNGNREQEISKISRGLKKVAKELDVPIIALSQLSRKVEERGAAVTPKLSDLRESGAIEQDADIVAFLYNATSKEVEENFQMKDIIHLDILKNRNGRLEDLLFVKNLSIQLFSESRDILALGSQRHSSNEAAFKEDVFRPTAGFENVEGEGLPF